MRKSESAINNSQTKGKERKPGQNRKLKMKLLDKLATSCLTKPNSSLSKARKGVVNEKQFNIRGTDRSSEQTRFSSNEAARRKNEIESK